METQKKYQLISDPGHAWLVVDVSELKSLGIADRISACSYIHGGKAYLEEDCDLAIFASAKGWQPDGTAPIEDVYEQNTPIRSYRHYRASDLILTA